MADHCMTLEDDGFAMVSGVLNADEIQSVVVSMGSMSSAGRRGVLAVPEIAKLARSERILALLRPYLPQEPVPVRGIYFDKSPDANWLVSWHQDLTITVHERVDSAGFGPWSVKDGVTHVQPPAELLAKMLTVRIHLDDADASNGALRVLRGSHRHGRLSAGQIQDMRSKCAEVLCAAKAGDALLIKPMILHASGRSSSEQHRRILHIEYAGFNLPDGMRWCDE